ncbi:MAG: ferritin-like domain-containing protein [Acidimicrobiales bacterium]
MSESAGRKYSLNELNELDSLDVDALRSMFTLELAGEQFYNALAERVGNEQAAELLRRNGREEAGHARRIDRAIAIKLGHEFTPSPDMLERPAMPLPENVGADLLRIIVQAEFDGDAGYQRWADNEDLPEVQRLLRLNGREETIHGRRVEQAIALMGQ